MSDELPEGEYKLADVDTISEEEEKRAFEERETRIRNQIEERMIASAVTAETFFRLHDRCMLIRGLSCNNGDCRSCNYIGFRTNHARLLIRAYAER